MNFLCKTTVATALFSLSCTLAGFDIILQGNAGPAGKTAARELEKYAVSLTGKKKDGKAPVFKITLDPSLKQEEWQIKSVNNGVQLSGGDGAGVLYAVWHYLEDHCGVRWWTPTEESVPKLSKLPVKNINRRGKPAFAIRALYESYGNDKGRFASQKRLNQDAWYKISAEYGGKKIIDGPYFVHAITMYLPSSKHFPKHPDWYAMIDGKRLEGRFKPGMHSQLYQMCLSNKELRKEFTKKLRDFILKSRKSAQARGEAMPLVYDISQADTQQYCRCPECVKMTKEQGGHSGLMLDFANDIAGTLGKEFPDILLNVCAYQYTQQVPSNARVKPADNVLVTLSDTLSNNTLPMEHKVNADFMKKMKSWRKITKNLRLWDYAITYRDPKGLPYVNEINFPADLKLLKKMNVMALQYEIQEPVLSDCRDYKFYLLSKFMEDPDTDFQKVSRDFALGYYGKAGEIFLKYRELLAKAQKQLCPDINMYPTASAFTHLNGKYLLEAQKLLDKGEKLLAGDTVKIRRWDIVRLSLNRAILARKRSLLLNHKKVSGSLEKFPFDMEKLVRQTEKIYKEQLVRKISKTSPIYKKTLLTMDAELRNFKKKIPESLLTPPKKFAHIPADRIFDFTPDIAQCYLQLFKLVEDPEAETGVVRRLEFNGDHRIGKFADYQKKLVWGICANSINRYWAAAGYHFFKPGGYQWYKLGESRVSSDAIFYFPWNWFLQINVAEAFDPNNEDAKFEVWANFKFTGNIIRGGNKNEPASISFQRLILIKK